MDNYYDHIEDYLENELSVTERVAFESALRQDPSLQEAVEEHRAIIEEINGMRLRQIIKKNLQKPSPQVWTDRHLWAIGALLLIFTTALVWIYMPKQTETETTPRSAPMPNTNETPIAGQNKVDATPTKSPSTSPSPSQPKNQDLPIDLNASLAYQEAVDQLEDLDFALMGDAKKDVELEKQLNKAIALLKSYKSKAAIPLLEKVISANNAFYQDDADWLLSLAWLVNDPAKSKTRLQAIAQNTAHSYRINAIRLFSKLK
jgi:tRNA nucleotidyltransferase/poly(A) polymerase